MFFFSDYASPKEFRLNFAQFSLKIPKREKFSKNKRRKKKGGENRLRSRRIEGKKVDEGKGRGKKKRERGEGKRRGKEERERGEEKGKQTTTQ